MLIIAASGKELVRRRRKRSARWRTAVDVRRAANRSWVIARKSRRALAVRGHIRDRAARGACRERLDRAVGVGKACAELIVAALRSQIFGAREQGLTDRLRREARLALEQQRHDPAYLRGCDRGAGRDLIGPGRRWREDI